MIIQIQLFNTLVVPVLTYGCETWSVIIIREIELLHTKFMEYIFHVHRYTSTYIVYGDSGVYPLEIIIKWR